MGVESWRSKTMQERMDHGRQDCSQGTLDKLAKHGADYVLATLNHFGVLRTLGFLAHNPGWFFIWT